MQLSKTKLFWTKLWLSIKTVGIIYIIIASAGVVLTAVSAIVSGISSNMIAVLISILSMVGFSLVLLLPLIITYCKFYKKIDIGILIEDVPVYIVTNRLCGLPDVFGEIIYKKLNEYVVNIINTLGQCGYIISEPIDVTKTLTGLVIVFISDISEKNFYVQWGIKYKKIEGLKYDSFILVEKSSSESIEETALEHEVYHVFVGMFEQDLKRSGKYSCVVTSLGVSF